MAFGRDGSELEMYVMDLQCRALHEALSSIAESSTCSDSKKKAKNALKRFNDIKKKYGED